MIREFCLPDVGEGISEAEIVRWLIAEGSTVNEDQDIVEIETDKAIVALPSPHAGKIVKLHHKEGDLTKVGEILVTIETDEAGQSESRAPRTERGTVVGAPVGGETIVVTTPVQAITAVPARAK